MSEFGKYNNKDILYEENPLEIENKNSEIYYNCSQCSSSIEIISINVKNNIIEFNCLNKESDHPKNIMPLKEYLEKMKKYNSRELNSDECEIHIKNNKYVSYCFNCSRHLCKECLKSRIHINHIKNDIIEIKPKNEELNIIEEVINDYKNIIENLTKEKENELYEKLNEEIENEKNNYKINIQKNEDREKEELKLNKDNYIEDISKIIKKYKEKINLRKKKYINDNNIICNKYKLINEKEKIINNNKINELKRKFDKEIKKFKV